MFDIVIPVGPKDYEVIFFVVGYVCQNVIGYRNIFLISEKNLNIPGTIFVDESIFPFTMNDVKILHGESHRNGWYFQQLLKFYAGFVIPNISSKYLIIDADTFFVKPVSFLENDIVLFNTSVFDHKPYFDHMIKLHPCLRRQDPNVSGICHHMMFDTACVLQLMTMVETYHGFKKSFWHIFLETVDPSQFENSGASEYEIYYNYMKCFHSDKIKIRNLDWKDDFDLAEKEKHHYISVHWHGRSPLNSNVIKN